VKHIEIDGFSLKLEGSLPILIAISEKLNLELELGRIFKTYNVEINDSQNLKKDGKYLYAYNLESKLSNEAHQELNNLKDIANIIIL